MDLLITIYLVGLVIAIWRASIVFYGFKLMKHNSLIDMFSRRVLMLLAMFF
ncbi:hypothetical protein HRQ65_13200 [Tatlockia micdadei]|nr:hypothetical protein [Legionella micdadei]